MDPVSPTPASATITIVLQSQPTGAANFNFTSSGFGSFVLTDNGVKTTAPYTNTKTFVVPSGTYTVAEQLVSGYLDTNISCNPPAGTIADIFNNQITINAAAGAKVTCTFAVQRASQIIAGSYNDHNHNHVRNSNDEWLNGWQMELHNPFNPNVAVQPTAGEGRTTFTNLFAGKYTVCETPLTGWVNITPGAVNATYGKPCYTVNVGAGQAVWIRFGNSTSPAIAEANAADAAGASEWLDVVICALPPTDVSGQELAAEIDPWELEENITTYNYLPSISRPAQ